MLTGANGNCGDENQMSAPGFIRATGEGVTLALKVQPRASTNEIVDASGDELRLRVTAPPVDAAANEAVIRYLAEVLGCSRNKVELVRGNTSRHKVVKVYGLGVETVLAALEQAR